MSVSVDAGGLAGAISAADLIDLIRNPDKAAELLDRLTSIDSGIKSKLAVVGTAEEIPALREAAKLSADAADQALAEANAALEKATAQAKAAAAEIEAEAKARIDAMQAEAEARLADAALAEQANRERSLELDAREDAVKDREARCADREAKAEEAIAEAATSKASFDDRLARLLAAANPEPQA